MSTPATPPAEKPQSLVIRKGSGDKPAETPGHVIAGKSLRERWGVKDTPVPKPGDAPAAPVAAAPPVEPIPAKVPPRKADGRFKKQPKSERPPSTKEIAEIAQAVVKAGETKAKEIPTPAPADPLAGLSAPQQKRYKVLQRMEAANPANKGLADKYVDATKKSAEYQKAWEADEANAGKKFNLADPEHSDFLAQNPVDYDEDEYAEALAEMKVDERLKPEVERRTVEQKQQEKRNERQQRLPALMPEISSHSRASERAYVDKLGEEFKGLLDDNNAVVPDVLNKLAQESDVHTFALNTAQRVGTFATELKAFAHDLIDFDPKNPLHAEIFQFVKAKDDEFKKERDAGRLPPELNGDKEFATSEEWEKMSPEERESHWTLSDSDLSALYAVQKGEEVKAMLDKADSDFNRRAERRGLIKTQPAPTPPPPPVPARQLPITPQPQRRPALEPSPSGVAAPRVAPTPQGQQTCTSELKKRWGLENSVSYEDSWNEPRLQNETLLWD